MTKFAPNVVRSFAMNFTILTLAFALVGTPTADADVDKTEIAAAQSFLSQYCQKCHGGMKHKGDFKIEHLSNDFSDKENRELWMSALKQLQTGEMPPEEEKSPPASEVQSVVNWISGRAGQAEMARRAVEGRVVLRRLNRAEYANTMRDLLGVEVDLTDLLPLSASTSGFDNNAESLHTSSYLMRSYLDAADRFLDEAIANTGRPYHIKKVFDIKNENTVKPTGSVYSVVS